MRLIAGTTLGPYEIVSRLGAGGAACTVATCELRRGLAEAQEQATW